MTRTRMMMRRMEAGSSSLSSSRMMMTRRMRMSLPEWRPAAVGSRGRRGWTLVNR
jgi:hypothetical protein